MNEIEFLSPKAIENNGLHLQPPITAKISGIEYLQQQAAVLTRSLGGKKIEKISSGYDVAGMRV